MLTEALKVNVPIAPFNGGMFVESDLTTVLEQLTIPLGVATQVVDYLLEEGLDVWVYSGGNWYLRRLDAPHVAHEQQTVQFAPSVVDDLHSVLNGAVKIVGVTDDTQRMARSDAELRRRVGRIRFCLMFTALLHRFHSPGREQGHGCANGLELFSVFPPARSR